MRYRFADCELDAGQMSLTRAGHRVPVEPQVFDLLHLLARHAERVVTKEEIVETVWQGRIVSESAISARIAAARKAVGDNGKRQAVIRTVARRGLQIVCEVDTVQQSSEPPATYPHIRYANTPDGHALGYAIGGGGPLLVRSGVTMTDIEAEWQVEAERRMLNRIQAHHQLLRYDVRGFGQSAGALSELSPKELAEDLRAVVDAAGYDRFAMYTESGGVHAALQFAATYPDRVSRLVIIGGYVHGRMAREGAPDHDPIRGLIAEGWRQPEAAFSNAYLLSYFPEGPLDVIAQFSQLLQNSCTPEQVLIQRDMVNHANNAALLGQIRCPTLIIHARHDAIHPLPEARKLAAGIANAQLAVLDTANHIPVYGNATWDGFMATFLGFLGPDENG